MELDGEGAIPGPGRRKIVRPGAYGWLMNDTMRGDRQLERFAREESDTLYSLFRRAVGDADVARDLLQDTFHDAWRNIDRYDEERPFRHWIIRIGLNRLRSFLRRQKLERKWVGTLAAEPPTDAPPDRRARADESARKLEAAIERLPEKQRVAILLRYHEGLSCAEIGDVLDTTPNAVSIQLHRARHNLRRWLGDSPLGDREA